MSRARQPAKIIERRLTDEDNGASLRPTFADLTEIAEISEERSSISMRLFAGTPFDRPPVCDTCGQLESACSCPPPAVPVTPPEKQTAKIAEEKRAKGKLVTVVRGLVDEGEHLPGLLKLLKDRCGAGGTAKDGVIELQGALAERVAALLRERGYRVKP